MSASEEESSPYRLIDISLDRSTLAAHSSDSEHERRIAIYDLLEENYFRPAKCEDGPYKLILSTLDQQLRLAIHDENDNPLRFVLLSLSPFRRIIKDYSFMCSSYYEAIKNAPPSRIETIDMSRRALHTEAAELLILRLDRKIDINFETARRLFTLIYALHQRGRT